MIKRFLSVLLPVFSLLLPMAAHADVPSLNVAPLKYEQQLEIGKLMNGYVDVANPSDATVAVSSHVQAFRQIGTDGNLEYLDDDRLTSAVKVDLTSFELGPREAIRVAFTVDPAKLGEGEANGVIFFRTEPRTNTPGGVQVQTSAQVGTLLLLSVGSGGTKSGQVAKVHAPVLALGKALNVGYSFTNTGHGNLALSFTPKLQAKVGWFGKWQDTQTGLVSAGITRDFKQTIKGNHFGIFPVAVRDQVTKTQKTSWVFGAMGIGGFLGLILFIAIAAAAVYWRASKRKK